MSSLLALPNRRPRGVASAFLARGSAAWQVRGVPVCRFPLLPLPSHRPNPYTGSPLDRVSSRREDAAFVAACRADPAARFLPVWRGRSLLSGMAGGRPRGVFLSAAAATELPPDLPWALLGLQEKAPVFALDLSAFEDPAALLREAGLPAGAEFLDLRAAAGALPAAEAAELAHARGLMHWRARHQFCGVCGGLCEPQAAGNFLVCTSCHTQHFPRTDPAVIMLVHHGDFALLAHSRRFARRNMFSTLAGFVEPGESAEEAVAREVREETRVEVARVRYHSSQPWPFPGSIMLGFFAEAASQEIVIDPEEIAEARWISRAEIRTTGRDFSLPAPDSIARRLIEDWVAAS